MLYRYNTRGGRLCITPLYIFELGVKMKVRKLLELQSTIEERKVPCDMNGELNKHYSESKEKEIDILDMDLIHLVRSYSKTLDRKNSYLNIKSDIGDNIDNILENINEVNRLLSE